MNRKNYYSNDRIELGKEIPLASPLAIHIEITNICNLSCFFCPHKEMLKIISPQFMDVSLFKKIIDDIEALNWYIPKINLNGIGETLLHPDVYEMLKYAYRLKCDTAYSAGIGKFEMITNGIFMTKWKENDERFNFISFLDTLIISIEGLSSDDYIKVCGYSLKLEDLINAIQCLYDRRGTCHIIVKIIDMVIDNKEDEQRFTEMFSSCADEINIEHLSNIWPQFEVSGVSDLDLTNRYGVDNKYVIENSKVCPQIFKTLFIRSDGKCIPCCYDWQNKLTIGDLKKEHLKEIWLGRRLKNLQLMMLEEKNKIDPCKDCVAYIVCDVDSVDGYIEDIRERIQGIDEV